MTARPFAARLATSLGTITLPLRRRRAITQLSSLDDGMLKDIGLCRVDVEAMRRMW